MNQNMYRIIAAGGALVIFSLRLGQFTNVLAFSTFIVTGFAFVTILYLSGRNRDYSSEEASQGTILAVIPAYNEPIKNLYATVCSLLAQTVPPDRIVVVDDGSLEPVVPFFNPKVWWIRQNNAGKRHAQAAGIKAAFDAGPYDFILTVDSDSVPKRDAVEQLLKAMSDKEVAAATGLPLLRNRARNLLTRITDMEIMYSCMTVRTARSAVGAVLPTSGALSIYRAPIVVDNLEDYVTSGTYSDDRKLTHYSLLKGKVVAVNSAIVETEMPETISKVYKQRKRWYQGALKAIPWEIKNLEGAPLTFRYWNTLMFVVWPTLLFLGFVVNPLRGVGISVWPFFYWTSLLYIQTANYLWRDGVSKLEKSLSWLCLTPLVMIFQLFLIRPTMYLAAKSLRDSRWGTRVAELEPAVQA